jgi:hypothetical protein
MAALLTVRNNTFGWWPQKLDFTLHAIYSKHTAIQKKNAPKYHEQPKLRQSCHIAQLTLSPQRRGRPPPQLPLPAVRWKLTMALEGRSGQSSRQRSRHSLRVALPLWACPHGGAPTWLSSHPRSC